MHVLVIPAWYDISNPIKGVFFHEYCNTLASKVKVTLLNIKFHSFSERFRRKQEIDNIGEKKYELLQIDYFSPLPGLSAAFLRQKIQNSVMKSIGKTRIKSEGWDIVHIQSVCNSITPWISKRIAEEYKIPYVLTEHYTSFREAGESIFTPFTSMNEIKQVVKGASRRFGVSDHACKYYKDIFESEFETVYNIIPDEVVNTPAIRNSTDDFNYTCIGNLQVRKGQALILDAFKTIHKELHHAKLVFVGDGVDKNKLKTMVKEYELEGKVTFINNVPKNEIIKIIDRSKVIISASENETFGLTLAEALLRGKPVISTKSGGPEEFVNQKNGILIDKGDVKALAESMKKISVDYEKYNSVSIRNEAIGKFSGSIIGNVMINKYNEVLRNWL